MANHAAEQEDEKQAQLALEQGFESEVSPPKKTAAHDEPKPEEKPEAKPETKTATKPAVEAKVEAAKPEIKKPEYVRLTKPELDALQAAAAKVTEFGPKLDKALGTFGNVHQIVKQLQAQTPTGAPVQLPKDVVAKLEEQGFGELAEGVRDALEKSIKGLRGTGTDAKPAISGDEVRKHATDVAFARELEDLEDQHPTWSTIVGKPAKDGDQPDPNNAFRKWLATQPAEYQAKVNSTMRPGVIARALNLFTAHQARTKVQVKKPVPKIEVRKNRMQAAITPRGDGGRPPPGKTADSEFEKGFAEG